MNKKIILGLVVLALFGSIFLFLPFLGNQFENYPPTPPDNYPSPTPPNGYQFSNDWLNKRSIHVYGNPPLDYLRAVNATGVTWSVYYGGLNETD